MTVPAIAASSAGDDDAPLLVLGPPLGTSSLVWRETAALLSEFRIITWDLPGHGLSAPAREPFTIVELAEAVLDLVGDATFYYAGVSMGGDVGLELALRHPERVTGLAMIASLAGSGAPTNWRERAATVRTQSTSVLLEASAKRWFSPGGIARLPDLTGRLLHTLADTDAESYALCCEALADFDRRNDLGSLTVPLLAISGNDDPIATPADIVAIAAAVQRGKSADVGDAGHLPPAEQPEVIASLLAEFFTKGAHHG